ncbi:MAG: hypothetical protein Q7K38_02795 [Candidatus Wildermuthbacteria bacterium]|nr:hypothetical protein [Candidatus Wildermuthbacteria bacterium]
MKEKNLIFLAVLVVLAAAAVGFSILRNTETIHETGSVSSPTDCTAFQDTEADIPCEEAVEQALNMFSGNVYDVKFETIAYQANLESEQVSVPSWIVYMKLDAPVELPNGKTDDVAVAVHSLHPEPYMYLYLAVQ